MIGPLSQRVRGLLVGAPWLHAGASLALALSACGGVRHATRGGGAAAKDETLVEVRTTGFESPYQIVSFSTWDVDPNEALPATAPAGVVADMRAEAARHGAEMLLLERAEDAWRKVWLGLGIVRAQASTSTGGPGGDSAGPSAVPVCTQAGFEAALKDARARAITCAKRVLYERPAVRGSIEVLFEVDPHGDVLRAAATPASSRDTELQQCVLGAVHASAFGEPVGFTCRGSVAVQVTGAAGSPGVPQ
jgi:hypothetical protein